MNLFQQPAGLQAGLREPVMITEADTCRKYVLPKLIQAGWDAFREFKSQITELRTRSERISKQLYGWIESLKNSGITGQ